MVIRFTSVPILHGTPRTKPTTCETALTRQGKLRRLSKGMPTVKEVQGTLRRLSRGMPTVEHVWYGRGAGSMLVRAALWPLSRAYDVAMSARSRLYEAGVL